MSLDGGLDGQFSKAFDSLLNPQLAASDMVPVPADGAEHEVLSAPPLGCLWALRVGAVGYSNQNVAPSAVTLRKFAPDGTPQVVDQRTLGAGPTFGGTSTAGMVGGLITDSRLTLQVSTGPVVFFFEATPVPAALVRGFYWVTLGLAEQAIDTSFIPHGYVARTVPQVPVSASGSGIPQHWQMNTSAGTPRMRWRVTRDGVTVYAASSTMAAASRVGLTPAIPPLKRGDVAAIASDIAPGAPVYCGGCFILTPEQGA